MKLCTVGLGYIGLPTSIMFAKYGVDVVGVDINEETVNSLNEGAIHIEEPGLKDELDQIRKKGNFKASLTPEKADVFIIAVPTPNNDDEFKSCDLSYVQQAVRNIIPHLEVGNTLIIESTIAPRSMEDQIKPMLEAEGYNIGEDLYLVHCPERVLPGKIMEELIYNNRIIGGVTNSCTEHGTQVYETFVKGKLMKTDAKTAEMSKLMENTYRDVNIALANELTQICNDLDINVLDVINMANMHPRVNIHKPGPGVGGHCLAVDPYFIISKSPEKSDLIKSARNINTMMPYYVIERINELIQNKSNNKITLFGASYKGNVDDIRESPAIKIYQELSLNPNLEVKLYDPHVNNPNLIEEDLKTALDNSDLLVVLTDHDEFKSLKMHEMYTMNQYKIFDTKGIIESLPEQFKYYSLGNLYLAKEEVMV